MMSSAYFRDAYMADIFRDQAGFAGTEQITHHALKNFRRNSEE
jgi:hypothetical protein